MTKLTNSLGGATAAGKNKAKRSKTSESDPAADVAVIKSGVTRKRSPALDASDFEYDSRELMHSD